MGVSGPFKGSRREFMESVGLGFVVRAESGRWQLREFPDQTGMHRWGVADRADDVRVTWVYPVDGGWSFTSPSPFLVGRRFESVGAAFEWWVSSR